MNSKKRTLPAKERLFRIYEELQGAKEGRHGYVEHLGNVEQFIQRYRSFAVGSLNIAHMCSADVNSVGQFFLTHAV